MARKTALAFDDREWVDREIDRLVQQLDGRQNGRGVKELVAHALVSMLDNLDSTGDAQARRAFKALALDGAVERAGVRMRQDECLVSYNGQVVALPARIGVPARGEDGVRGKHYNQRLWWHCTWPQLQDWLAQQEATRAQQATTIAVVRRILALREKYPDTVTPGEACEREGLDPREFSLEVALG